MHPLAYEGRNSQGQLIYTVRNPAQQPEGWTVYHHPNHDVNDLANIVCQNRTLSRAQDELSQHFARNYNGAPVILPHPNQPASAPQIGSPPPTTTRATGRNTIAALAAAGIAGIVMLAIGVGGGYYWGQQTGAESPVPAEAVSEAPEGVIAGMLAAARDLRPSNSIACGDLARDATGDDPTQDIPQPSRQEEAQGHALAAHCYALASQEADGQQYDEQSRSHAAQAETIIKIYDSEGQWDIVQKDLEQAYAIIGNPDGTPPASLRRQPALPAEQRQSITRLVTRHRPLWLKAQDNLAWLPKDEGKYTVTEGQALAGLEYLARVSDAAVLPDERNLAAEAIEWPLLETPAPGSGAALTGLADALYTDPQTVAQLLQHDLFRTGPTGEWAPMLAVMPSIARRQPGSMPDLLSRDHVTVQESQVRLPGQPPVRIAIVRLQDSAPPDAMNHAEEAVKQAIDYHNRPFPQDMVAIIYDTDIAGHGNDGVHVGTHIAITSRYDQAGNQNLPDVIAHEIAHFYWHRNAAWLDEAMAEAFAADFLARHLNLADPQPSNAPCDDPDHRYDDGRDPPTECDYANGERLMLYLAENHQEQFRKAVHELSAPDLARSGKEELARYLPDSGRTTLPGWPGLAP